MKLELLVKFGMAEFGHFSSLARPLQCCLCSPDGPTNQPRFKGIITMSAFEFASNKALAAVFAIGASAIMMAYAIVPASPAGLLA